MDVTEEQLARWERSHFKLLAIPVYDGQEQPTGDDICAYCGFYWPCSTSVLLASVRTLAARLEEAERERDDLRLGLEKFASFAMERDPELAALVIAALAPGAGGGEEG